MNDEIIKDSTKKMMKKKTKSTSLTHDLSNKTMISS
jgi:hypothetical protein